MSCVFCELFAADAAQWVAREADAVAFLPLPDSSLAPGHTLVAPRRHCVGVLDADEDTLLATMRLIQRVGWAMRSALAATGIVTLSASGPHSGQSVAHWHVHVMPRWPDDTTPLWPTHHSQHTVHGDVRQALHQALAR